MDGGSTILNSSQMMENAGRLFGHNLLRFFFNGDVEGNILWFLAGKRWKMEVEHW